MISTAFGGADKRAETFAGRFVFAGHSFFCMIILATYTGSLGAYLSSIYTLPTLNHYSDLTSGDYSVAVVGPRWNSTDPAAVYKGQYMGGDGVDGSSPQVPPPSARARLVAGSGLFRILRVMAALPRATAVRFITSPAPMRDLVVSVPRERDDTAAAAARPPARPPARRAVTSPPAIARRSSSSCRW